MMIAFAIRVNTGHVRHVASSQAALYTYVYLGRYSHSGNMKAASQGAAQLSAWRSLWKDGVDALPDCIQLEVGVDLLHDSGRFVVLENRHLFQWRDVN